MNLGESIPLVSNSNNRYNNQENQSNSSIMSDVNGFPNYITVIVIVFVFVFVIATFQSNVLVQPGNIGLIVTLGNVVAVESGMHLKMPFLSHVVVFTAKTQKLEENNNTPTKEGLSVQLDTAM